MQEQIALKSTRSVSMKIQQNISHIFLFVEGKLETDIDGFGCKSLLVTLVGFEYLRVVDKSRGADQHKCQLLAQTVMRIFDHLEIHWLFELRYLISCRRGLSFLF